MNYHQEIYTPKSLGQHYREVFWNPKPRKGIRGLWRFLALRIGSRR